ncbi:MAG: thioredoxin family protein [Acidilobus sp.]
MYEKDNDAWLNLSEKLEERAFYLERALKEFVVNVTQSNMSSLINENKVLFLYFTAEWCGPCINFYKTFKEVATKYLVPGVAFGKVDVDSAYAVADKYQVRHIPSILIIADGKVVDTIVGQVSKDELEKRMGTYIKKALAQH